MRVVFHSFFPQGPQSVLTELYITDQQMAALFKGQEHRTRFWGKNKAYLGMKSLFKKLTE